MAPATKRAVVAASSVAKKARVVVDPITEKIDLIAKTISDPACRVPEPESHREMLLLSMPHTLTVPSDERHEYQTQVATMVGKVLGDHVADWEKEVSDSQDNIGASAQKAEATMKLVEESAVKIDAQETEVQKCKDNVNEDSEAVKVAEEALQSATKEVAEFDDKLMETIVKKGEISTVHDECFIPLKNGACEGKEAQGLVKKVEPLMKKLGIESSLLSALAPAMKKSPSERGTFDVMAVDGTEGVFRKHLGELQEQIDKADVVKAEKVSAQAAAQEALDAAVSKRTASEAVFKSAEEELAALEANHKDLYEAASVTSQVAADSDAVLAIKKAGLVQAKEVLGTFTELLERQSTVPEPAAEDISMVEDKVQAINEATSLEEPIAMA